MEDVTCSSVIEDLELMHGEDDDLERNIFLYIRLETLLFYVFFQISVLLVIIFGQKAEDYFLYFMC